MHAIILYFIFQGLTPSEIVSGFELALEKALEVLPTLVVDEVKDYRNEDEVFKVIRTAVMSKQLGNEDFLAKLITKACSKSNTLLPIPIPITLALQIVLCQMQQRN